MSNKQITLSSAERIRLPPRSAEVSNPTEGSTNLVERNDGAPGTFGLKLETYELTPTTSQKRTRARRLVFNEPRSMKAQTDTSVDKTANVDDEPEAQRRSVENWFNQFNQNTNSTRIPKNVKK